MKENTLISQGLLQNTSFGHIMHFQHKSIKNRQREPTAIAMSASEV